MRRVILFLSLLLLSVNSCEDKVTQQIEIVFSMSSGLPLVEMELNGKKAKFLVDSGAMRSVLNISNAEAYGYKYIPVSGLNFTGAGGAEIKGGLISDAVVKINDKTLQIRFRALDMDGLSKQLGVVGIIGSDYLDYADYVLDYKNDVIYIK